MTRSNQIDLDFSDLSVKELNVKVGENTYVLREADGDAACKYRNAKMACLSMSDDGKLLAKDGMADIEPLLVSLCMRQISSTGVLAPSTVPIETVRSWPARILEALYDKAVEISNLGTSKNKEEEAKTDDQLKKPQTDTMGGSS